MDEPFSSIDFVVQCLVDSDRTHAFERAIKNAVTSESFVLDSGTGSGIMSLFAARHGAKSVTALEIDPYVASVARKHVEDNGFSSVITVVNEDIRSHQFDTTKKFDVVIMEMLTTGMIDEYQVWAVNYLHKNGIIDQHTKMIPYRHDTHITLVNADFSFYGFTMKVPVHTWAYIGKDNPRVTNLSGRELLNEIYFDRVNDEQFSAEISFTATEDGTANAVYLDSTTFLDAENIITDTLSLNGPVLIPLKEEIQIIKGENVVLKISYHFGNGYRNFHITKI